MPATQPSRAARSSLVRALLVVVAVIGGGLAGEATAQNHRGSVGVSLAGGGALQGVLGETSAAERGGALIDLGASLAIDADGNELQAFVRGSFGATTPELSAAFGYRGYFGPDAWKTFFDVGLVADATPRFAAGPRLGLGVQYDFHPLLGGFVVADARFMIGPQVRAVGSLSAGLQLRSYWFQ